MFLRCYQPRDKGSEECFHATLDCLSRTKRNVLSSAIERAKTITTTLFKTVQSALDMKHIISAGPFVYYIVQEVSIYMYVSGFVYITIKIWWRLWRSKHGPNIKTFEFDSFCCRVSLFYLQGSLDWHMLSQHHILLLLAHFILRAYVSMSRNRKASSLPLIVSAPANLESGTCILMGIPPLCENSPRKLVKSFWKLGGI